MHLIRQNVLLLSKVNILRHIHRGRASGRGNIIINDKAKQNDIETRVKSQLNKNDNNGK